MAQKWKPFELEFIESLSDYDLEKKNLPELFKKVFSQNFPQGGNFRIWLSICYVTDTQLYIEVRRPNIILYSMGEDGDKQLFLFIEDRDNMDWNPEKVKEIVANWFYKNLELNRSMAISLAKNAYIEMAR